MSKENQDKIEISHGFQKMLDKHGFSFQYAVLKRAQELREEGTSKWVLLAVEFPIFLNGEVSHIDFILQYKNSSIFLIGECKRAEPSKSNWCFVKAPYGFRGKQRDFIYFDNLKRFQDDYPNYGCVKEYIENEIYHLGLEIKSNEKGDGIGSDRSIDKSPINRSVTQVLTASSGFITHLFSRPYIYQLENDVPQIFIPAIFTTAITWVSKDDISSANPNTGFLSPNVINIEKKDWIWFNHNRSQHLCHGLTKYGKTNMSLEEEFIRSVAIIGKDGIDSFLNQNIEDWFN